MTSSLGGRSRVPRETSLVVIIAPALLALAAVAGAPFLGQAAFLPSPTLPWWAMAAAFAATEGFVVHVQVRRQPQRVSLSEFPLVLGLFFAAPLALVVGGLVGSALAFVGHRRPPLKTAVNLAAVAAETCVALAVFRLVVAWAGGSAPAAWTAAFAA